MLKNYNPPIREFVAIRGCHISGFCNKFFAIQHEIAMKAYAPMKTMSKLNAQPAFLTILVSRVASLKELGAAGQKYDEGMVGEKKLGKKPK